MPARARCYHGSTALAHYVPGSLGVRAGREARRGAFVKARALMSASVIALSGDLDIYNAKVVCRVLDQIAGPAVIDMSGVAFVDGSGLTELVHVARRSGPGNVVLVVPSPQLRRVLGIVGFGELFHIVERLDVVDTL